MNQPILITDLYVGLDRIKGVQTVKNIKILSAWFIVSVSYIHTYIYLTQINFI